MLVITKESDEHQTKHPIMYCLICKILYKRVLLNSVLDFLKPSIKRVKKKNHIVIFCFLDNYFIYCFLTAVIT